MIRKIEKTFKDLRKKYFNIHLYKNISSSYDLKDLNHKMILDESKKECIEIFDHERKRLKEY